MEATFGGLWGDRLVRVKGVGGVYEAKVFQLMVSDERGQKAWEYHHNPSNTNGHMEMSRILSHLLAIKQAYLDGKEVVLIMEDDTSPLFMPFWTKGIGDVLKAVYKKAATWDSIQLSYIVNAKARPFNPPSSPDELVGGVLLKTDYQWGTGGYLVSRRGMEKVMREFFTDMTNKALIIPSMKTREEGDAVAIDTGYLYDVFTDNYVTVPAMLVPEITHSTYPDSDRRERDHAASNAFHWTLWSKQWKGVLHSSAVGATWLTASSSPSFDGTGNNELLFLQPPTLSIPTADDSQR